MTARGWASILSFVSSAARFVEPIHDAGVHQQPFLLSQGELSVPTANKEILEQANAAIAQGDFEGFLAWCTEDTVWTFEGDRTLRGKAAVREWMKTTYQEPPKFKVHRMIAEGDFVAALGEITLKDATGQTARYAYCDVWRFREGKMAELQAFVVASESPAQHG